MKKLLMTLLIVGFFSSANCQWTYEIPLYHQQRNKQDKVRVWYNSPNIRGFMLFTSIGNAFTYATNPTLRNYLSDNQLGIVYIRTQQYGMSVFKPNTDSAFFWKVLDSVAIVTGIPAFKHGSWVLFGHSTDGLFVQNVACWKPERTLGMLHYKSGNLGNKVNMQAPWNNLDAIKNIPFLAINGRFEQFGPNGPFPGCSQPFPSSCYREVQWLSMRDTLMKLRQRNFLVCQAVDNIGLATHDTWSGQSGDLMSKFVVAVANAQLPAGYPDAQPFTLNRMQENQGTLSDSSISWLITQNTLPSFPVEAEYDLFPSQNENIAYWHPSKEFAEAWVQFHRIHASYLPPLKPLNLVAQTLAYDKIQIGWSNTTINETGFIIQRKTASGMFQTIDTVPANTLQFVDTGLIGNTEYIYRMYAWNSYGVSALSNQDSSETFLTGISDQEKRKKIRIHISQTAIKLFPNGEKIEEIVLFSLAGKEIKTDWNQEHTLPFPAGIPKGIYLFRIRFKDQTTQTETILLKEE